MSTVERPRTGTTARCPAPARSRHVAAVWISLGLVPGNQLVYWQVRDHPFITFDDPQHVVETPAAHQRMGWGDPR